MLEGPTPIAMHHGYEKNHAEKEFLYSGKEAIRKYITTSMTQEFTSKPSIYTNNSFIFRPLTDFSKKWEWPGDKATNN